MTETLHEGDGDITLTLREYKFSSDTRRPRRPRGRARDAENAHGQARGHALGHCLRAVRRRDTLARDRAEKRRDRAEKAADRKGSGAVRRGETGKGETVRFTVKTVYNSFETEAETA